MLAHYLALGLAPEATQEQIRQAYLALVRAHPPGRDPERFQRVATAYEALQDARVRVRTTIFGMDCYGDFELALEDYAQARRQERKTPGLQTLLAAEGLTK